MPGTQRALSVDNFISFITVELLKLIDLGFFFVCFDFLTLKRAVKEGSVKVLLNVTNFLIIFDLNVDTLRLPLRCQIWYFTISADGPQGNGCFAEMDAMNFVEREILSVTGVYQSLVILQSFL